jgi:mannosyltransferase OCH1-like enzyme/Flp pilus assembly protein TadD
MPPVDDQSFTAASASESIEDLRRKGLVSRSEGRHEAARAAFDELLSRQPRDARSHVDLAISLRALGRSSEAIEILEEALDDVCSVAFRRQCALQLARCHQTVGHLKAARLYLEEVVRLAPDDVPALLELASICSRSLEREVARSCLTRVATLVASTTNDSHKSSYVNQLADFEWLHGDPDAAIQALSYHSHLYPDFPTMRRLLSYLVRCGRPREAIEELQRCYATGVFSTKDEKCLALHIETLKFCGDLATASALAELGISVFPNSESIRLILSDIHASKLDIQAAHDVLIPQQPGDAMSLARARLFKLQGKIHNSRLLLQECIDLNNLTNFQRTLALKNLFHLEMFLLNCDRSRFILNLLSENSSEQHLVLLYSDQCNIFEIYRDELQAYLSTTDLRELCKIHLNKMKSGFDVKICCASWMFMNRIGKERRWWSLCLKDIFVRTLKAPIIPAIIVQYWDQNDVPSDVAKAIESWRVTYPDFKHVIYNRITASKFLLENFREELLSRFDASSHPAMRSGIFRMAWLFKNGGFYVDADEICLGRSPVFFLSTQFISPIVIAEEYETQNGFIGSVAGHQILLGFLENLLSTPEEEFRTSLIWWLTGPGHMGRLLSTHVANRLLAAGQHNEELDELISDEAIILPKPVLEMSMMTPRMKYKQSELSWQRARSQSNGATGAI